MKTSEFIKFFEDEGLIVDMIESNSFFEKGIYICDDTNEQLMDILENNTVGTDTPAFVKLPFEKQQEYYKVILEYVMTPPEEREEEKEYYLRQVGIRGHKNYLNYHLDDREFFTGDKNNITAFAKTQFTQKEIDEMPECYTHPAVWEQVPVPV